MCLYCLVLMCIPLYRCGCLACDCLRLLVIVLQYVVIRFDYLLCVVVCHQYELHIIVLFSYVTLYRNDVANIVLYDLCFCCMALNRLS